MKRQIAFPLALASSMLLMTGCPSDVAVTTDPLPTSPPPTETAATPLGGLSLTHAQMPPNSWTVGAPMAHARGGLSAGVVDGRIFALGGDSEASLEIYHPAQDTWRLDYLPDFIGDASLRPLRTRQFGAAVASQGRIVYVGGTYNSIVNFMDVYNPVTNRWLDVATPFLATGAFGRMNLAVTELDGEIVVLGGLVYTNAPETAPVADVVSFTFETQTGLEELNEKAPLPVPRAGLAAAVLDHQLYVVGGFSASPNGPDPEALGSMIRYQLNDWSDKTLAGAPLPPLNQPRHSFGSAVLDGKWIVAGGVDSDGNVLDSVEEYDPGTNTWTLKAPMPSARAHVALAALNGRLFALGGFDTQRRALRSVDVFRP
jgi:hypothetical protein